jgi:hypothetical protein
MRTGTPLPPSRRAFAHIFLLVLVLIGAVAQTGCANYTLGPRAKLPFTTINILPIENDTQAPQTLAILTQQLSDAFVQEPSLRLVPTDGQAALYVRLSSYDHNITTTRPDDTVLARSFTLRLRAQCTLVDKRTGKAYFTDREITASADAHDTGTYNAVESQTLPILTRELAQKIRATVTATW